MVTPEVNEAIRTLHREISRGHHSPKGAHADPNAVYDRVESIISEIANDSDKMIFRKWLLANGWGNYGLNSSSLSPSFPIPDHHALSEIEKLPRTIVSSTGQVIAALIPRPKLPASARAQMTVQAINNFSDAPPETVIRENNHAKIQETILDNPSFFKPGSGEREAFRRLLEEKGWGTFT